MPDLPSAAESGAPELLECANRTSAMLRGDASVAPIAYRELSQSVAELARRWRDHVDSFARAQESARVEDPHRSIFLAQLQKDSGELADALDALSSAGPPRTMSLGVAAMRTRAAQLVAAVFRQLDKEQTLPPAGHREEYLMRGEKPRPATPISS